MMQMQEAMVRLNVVETFRGYLGRYDDEFLLEVWRDVGVTSSVAQLKKLHHCGATALFIFKKCGLFLDRKWVLGKGFVWKPTPVPQIFVADLEPGDLVHFDYNDHWAVVTDPRINPVGEIRIIQGNGAEKRVTETWRSAREVQYCFSIQKEVERICASS